MSLALYLCHSVEGHETSVVWCSTYTATTFPLTTNQTVVCFQRAAACESEAQVIFTEPNSGTAADILHILIVKTAVTVVTGSPQ